MSKDLEAEPMLFLDEYTELARTRSNLINAKPDANEVYVYIKFTDGYEYPAKRYCDIITEDGEACTFEKDHTFECSFDADIPLNLVVVKPRATNPDTLPFIIDGGDWDGLAADLEELEAPE